MTVNKLQNIEVRLVQTGKKMYTIRTGDDNSHRTKCITLVPGHLEWIVTSHVNGAVYLRNIKKKGARAFECMNVNAGKHVRQIVQLGMSVDKIVASSTRLMCVYDNTKVAIVHFDDGRPSMSS